MIKNLYIKCFTNFKNMGLRKNMKHTGANGRRKTLYSIGRTRRFTSPFAILLFALIICSCTKVGMGNVKADSYDGTIIAKVKNGTSYNAQISKVWALYDATINSTGQLNEQSLASGNYHTVSNRTTCLADFGFRK